MQATRSRPGFTVYVCERVCVCVRKTPNAASDLPGFYDTCFRERTRLMDVVRVYVYRFRLMKDASLLRERVSRGWLGFNRKGKKLKIAMELGDRHELLLLRLRKKKNNNKK